MIRPVHKSRFSSTRLLTTSPVYDNYEMQKKLPNRTDKISKPVKIILYETTEYSYENIYQYSVINIGCIIDFYRYCKEDSLYNIKQGYFSY